MAKQAVRRRSGRGDRRRRAVRRPSERDDRRRRAARRPSDHDGGRERGVRRPCESPVGPPRTVRRCSERASHGRGGLRRCSERAGRRPKEAFGGARDAPAAAGASSRGAKKASAAAEAPSACAANVIDCRSFSSEGGANGSDRQKDRSEVLGTDAARPAAEKLSSPTGGQFRATLRRQEPGTSAETSTPAPKRSVRGERARRYHQR